MSEAAHGHSSGGNYLTHSRGFLSWVLTLDHKRIGVMYLVAILLCFLLGGILALMIRLEMWTPGPTIMNHDTYNQVFTQHGAIMVFLVIIPGIPAALGNFILPLMLGAKDVAFPRLNLASFHMWMCGLYCFLYAIHTGGLDTGWTFYAPYSTNYSQTAVVAALMGAFLLGFSSIFTGLNFIVTIHKLRPPGMVFYKIPLFLWSIYATALIQVLATPVLGITLLLLIVERTVHIGIFDPKLGGDPVLMQHFFWFYSHPAVYIMVVPGLGLISELIATFSRKDMFGYKLIGFSSIAIAILGFLVWGHHMFVSGQSQLMSMIFSALTFTISIPSAIKVFNWLATMYKGSISLQTPMLYALAFIFLFGIGGLTGLFLAALSTDVHLTDTYFVVAHFHYVMMGSGLVAFLGGLYYWWPKMTGKMYRELPSQIGATMVFIGFNLTFLPQFVLGTRGYPRRYFNYDYDPSLQTLHQISTTGALILAAGLVLGALTLLHSLFKGTKAHANPWGGATLEWACSSPPPHDNFAEPPVAGHPYDMHSVVYDPNEGGFVPNKAHKPVSHEHAHH